MLGQSIDGRSIAFEKKKPDLKPRLASNSYFADFLAFNAEPFGAEPDRSKIQFTEFNQM